MKTAREIAEELWWNECMEDSEKALKGIERALIEYRDQGLDEAIEICEETIKCNDPAHDSRWCGTCNAIETVADAITDKILSLKKGKVNQK